MSEDRFQRFRRLERRRTGEQPAAESAPGTGKRFEALEERAPGAPAPPDEPVASGHLDRFRPAAERPLELAIPEGAGELPFVQCARCRADCHRSNTTCPSCGENLWTDEQRAYNAALATRRLAEKAELDAQVETLEQRRAAATSEEARVLRTAAEEMARAVGDAERRRLDAEGIGGAPGGWRGATGWRQALGFAGWILLGILKFLFRARLRRW